MRAPMYQAAPLPSRETLSAHLNATRRDPDGARQQDPGGRDDCGVCVCLYACVCCPAQR